MIRLEAVSAGYPGRPVLRDITLDVRPGEVLALVGPNGSGKSTLLKAALGLLPLTGGQVLYDGLPLEKLTPRERARKAALLTQSRNTPSIQALRMVLHGRFPYLAYPRRYGREDEAIARGAMARTGCLELAGENVAQLSGGQRQGVYLAMTLAQDTETVFMDEPTTYLDIHRQIGIMETSRELAREGKAVVLVLHDLPMALTTAHRVAVLEAGRLAMADTAERVYRSGVLERVFQVGVHRMDTPQGVQYYCVPRGL